MATQGEGGKHEECEEDSQNSSNSYATVASSGSNMAQRLFELENTSQDVKDEQVDRKPVNPSMQEGSASVLLPDFSTFRPAAQSPCSRLQGGEGTRSSEEIREMAVQVQAELRACGFEKFPLVFEDTRLVSGPQDESATLHVSETFLELLLLKLQEVIMQYKKRGVLVEDFLTGDKSPLKQKHKEEVSDESFLPSRSPLLDSPKLFLPSDPRGSKKTSPGSDCGTRINQFEIDWSCTYLEKGQHTREEELLRRIDETRRKEAKLLHLLHDKEQMLEQCQERLRIMLKESDRRRETALKVVRAAKTKQLGKDRTLAGLDPRTAALIHELAEMNHALEKDRGRLEEENKSVMARLRDVENTIVLPMRGGGKEAVNFGRLREDLIQCQRTIEELKTRVRDKENEAQLANARKESILSSCEELQQKVRMMEAQQEETPKPEYVASLERAMWSMEKEMAEIKYRLKSDLNVFKDLGTLLGSQDHSSFITTIRRLKEQAADMEEAVGTIRQIFMELPAEERTSYGELESQGWKGMLRALANRMRGSTKLDAWRTQVVEEELEKQDKRFPNEEGKTERAEGEEEAAIAVLAEIEAVLSKRVSPLALNALHGGLKLDNALTLSCSRGQEVVEEVRDLVAYERCCLTRTYLEGEDAEGEEEEKVCRELLMQVQALLGVDSVSSILPRISRMREFGKEADRARASLILMLRLPLEASWQDCLERLQQHAMAEQTPCEKAEAPSPEKTVPTRDADGEEEEREEEERVVEEETFRVRSAPAGRKKPVAWELRLDSQTATSMREDSGTARTGLVVQQDPRSSLQVTLIPLPEDEPSSPRAGQGVLQEACGRHLLARARRSATTALQPPRRWRPPPVTSAVPQQPAGSSWMRGGRAGRTQR